jgi:predicted membrane-bound dolichyl-phosphate-mannose-protein mannosyltransferase
MAVQINEKTEVTVPLKLLISIVGVIVISSWYVFTTQNRIKELEHSVKIIEERFISYTKQPGRNTTDVELLKKDMEHLRKQVEKGLK